MKFLRFCVAWILSTVVLLLCFTVIIATDETGEVTISGAYTVILLIVPIVSGVLAAKKRKKQKTRTERISSHNENSEVAVKQNTPKNRATKFAEYVLANYGGGIESGQSDNALFEFECQRLISDRIRSGGLDTSERIYLLTVAGDRLEASSAYETHLKIQCYIFAGSSCRSKVIQYLPGYLSGDNLWVPGYQDPRVYKELLTLQLAKCYEGEKMYHQALEQFELLYNLDKSSEYYAVSVVRVLNKMAMFDVSLQFIEDQKNTRLYQMTGFQYRRFYESKEESRLLKEYTQQGFDRATIKMLMKPSGPRMHPENRFKIQLDWAEIATGAAIEAKRNRDDYTWIEKNIPDICPKSFSGYMRMRNQRTKNFMAIYQTCLDRGRDILIEDKYAEQSIQWKEIQKTEHPLYYG